jgi:phospholipid/cholesterol/gamma-HCH transport system permease protein
VRLANTAGQASELLIASSVSILTGRCRFWRTLEQLDQAGLRTLPIVVIALLFTGAVMTVHTATALAEHGAELKLAQILLVSMLRELSPMLTALLVAGRVGAGIAAELGAMQLSEQLPAMRALSLDITAELVAPRLLAVTCATLVLVAVGDVAGVAGGYLVAVGRQGISLPAYHAETCAALRWVDFGCGLFKGAIFGASIALIGLLCGMATRRGAGELGRNTQRAVVIASVWVLVGDYFLTELYFLWAA